MHIITTSHFTQQAVDFAHNKNIELIGYDVLNSLLNEYKIELNGNSKNYVHNFTGYEDFDNEKYNYLKTKIEENRSEKSHYIVLQDFYHKYILMKKYEIIKSGLLDNYINLNDEII